MRCHRHQSCFQCIMCHGDLPEPSSRPQGHQKRAGSCARLRLRRPAAAVGHEGRRRQILGTRGAHVKSRLCPGLSPACGPSSATCSRGRMCRRLPHPSRLPQRSHAGPRLPQEPQRSLAHTRRSRPIRRHPDTGTPGSRPLSAITVQTPADRRRAKPFLCPGLCPREPNRPESALGRSRA